jgi:hypothetical protein
MTARRRRSPGPALVQAIADERMNEYDSDEWYDVCKSIQPSLTREQFDDVWADFQAEKAEHERKKTLN